MHERQWTRGGVRVSIQAHKRRFEKKTTSFAMRCYHLSACSQGYHALLPCKSLGLYSKSARRADSHGSPRQPTGSRRATCPATYKRREKPCTQCTNEIYYPPCAVVFDTADVVQVSGRSLVCISLVPTGRLASESSVSTAVGIRAYLPKGPVAKPTPFGAEPLIIYHS